jgi:hypothetical protein
MNCRLWRFRNYSKQVLCLLLAPKLLFGNKRKQSNCSRSEYNKRHKKGMKKSFICKCVPKQEFGNERKVNSLQAGWDDMFYLLVPNLPIGNALVQEALLPFLHAISSIPDRQLQILYLHQEYMKRQNCISNADVLLKVSCSKYLLQE